MIHLITVNPQVCNGCKTCEVACSLHRAGECRPDRARIRVERQEERGLVNAVPVVCQQCENPPCREACPTEAIVEDGGPSRIRIQEEACTGCAACTQACPIGAIRVDLVQGVARTCDLCQGAPKCVALCHSGSLGYTAYEAGNESHRVGHLVKALQAEGLLD
ncbi:MAG: 4Fe-4S dicluster domain-containing protein [Candidatus Tectomicrobia bacterium]|uniref:4Fe-4S dicluster domain-containing protein n=1 Tax=Tectimicrobiota bacterium TaxID=2528274 RepID=A0A932CPI8_UNCTE|nr:4Fe-4S dicluster domain-containing protein [Candidatus Tectomicrobia bacterium]